MNLISLILVVCFVLLSVWLSYSLWRTNRQNALLREKNRQLQARIAVIEGQLQQALQQISEYEKSDSATDGLLERAVQGLVALGTPGIVLLVAVSSSGFVGAAALTSGLATLGGPFGMVGGIGVLLLLLLVSKALTNYGFSKMSTLVVRGLVAKGLSIDGIRDQVDRLPKWLISNELRTGIEGVLRENQDDNRSAGHGNRTTGESALDQVLANSHEVRGR
jgi:hypothetical protein